MQANQKQYTKYTYVNCKTVCIKMYTLYSIQYTYITMYIKNRISYDYHVKSS